MRNTVKGGEIYIYGNLIDNKISMGNALLMIDKKDR